MDSVKLLNYMENLRYDRKMTQEDYLFDVISQRQYYRYRSGETEVPFEVIIKFANKLQIPLLKLFASYQAEVEKESKIAQNYLNLIVNQNIEEAKKLLKRHKNLLLLDEEAKIFFQIGTLLQQFHSNKLSEIEMISLLKEKIGYENILKKTVLHDSEVYFLGTIMDFSSKDREIIYQKIQDLREKNKLLLGGNILFNGQVFFWIIKNLGRMERFEELIDFANEAIELNKSQYSVYAMEYFYYYKALAYHALDQQKKLESALEQTIYYLLHAEKQKQKHFFKMIKEDLDIDHKAFIIKKIEKEL